MNYPTVSKNLENGGRTIEHEILVDMTEYGFTENIDYQKCFPNLESGCNGGQNMIDYEISVDLKQKKTFFQKRKKVQEVDQLLIMKFL